MVVPVHSSLYFHFLSLSSPHLSSHPFSSPSLLPRSHGLMHARQRLKLTALPRMICSFDPLAPSCLMTSRLQCAPPWVFSKSNYNVKILNLCYPLLPCLTSCRVKKLSHPVKYSRRIQKVWEQHRIYIFIFPPKMNQGTKPI
jgi:hypothetical protein